MNSVLLTGFEPFGGDLRNPSGEIARSLNGSVIGGAEVSGLVLPCVFGESIAILRNAIATRAPRLVICLGVAANRREITPERIAINLDDARIPDNAGRRPLDEPIVPNAPAAYWSTLPNKAIVRALQLAGLPAALSHSAGTFVCNHVFFGLMHALRDKPDVHGGFIHIPFPDSTLLLDSLAAGISLAVETAQNPPQKGLDVAGAID